MHARRSRGGSRLAVFAAAAITLVLGSGVARAFPDGEVEARALYKRALQAYDLGEYDRAIADFKQCYELSGRAELLFNLGQAYRAKKDYDAALHSYRTFLELKPNAPNRAEVESFIAEVVRAQAAPPQKVAPEKSAQPEKAQPPTGASQPPTGASQPPTGTMPAAERAPGATAPNERVPLELRPQPPPRTPPINGPLGERPSYWRTTRGRGVIALAAVGAAFLIAGAATGGSALDERGRYDRGCDLGACDHSLYAGAHALALATDVLLAVGVAGGVAAIVWAVVGPRLERRADHARAKISPAQSSPAPAPLSRAAAPHFVMQGALVGVAF